MKLTITQEFYNFLKGAGLDLPQLLERASLPNKEWQEEIELTNLEYYQLLEACDRFVTEEVVRQISQIKDIQTFIPAFFAALAAKDGQEALEQFTRFKRIVGPIDVVITESARDIAVQFRFIHPQMPLPKFSVLNEQLVLLNILRQGSGEKIVSKLVESPYAYDEATVAEFASPFHQAQENLMIFDKKDLEKRFLSHNNLMWTYLEKELYHQLAYTKQEDRFTSYVEKELFSAIPAGDFSLEAIAERLGVSPRTLQRNLSNEETSFKKEVQKVQKLMTFSYLDLAVSTEEIASLVGYSEINAFYRAFKKWTGMTLSDYRQMKNEE